MTTVISPLLAEALRDRYLLQRELGRGGMATVYLAHDLKHDRLVALKVLRAELGQALGPERFLREIKLAARLQHPHILSVHDSGEAAGQLWFTMPYVEGETLRERLTREPQFRLEDAVRIALGVADALGYAHRHGIIHRDIKPENILLSGDHCVVADFGIARALDASAERLTDTGLVLGTPAYMSPEQAVADAHLDGRSDIYSLGCVLYEMLAGQPPFTGRTAQAIILRRLSEPLPPLRIIRDIPEQVEQVVSKALGRSPADRFRDAPSFAAALEAAAVASTGPSARMSRRTAPTRVAAAVAGALLVVAAAGGLYRRLHRTAAAAPDTNLLAIAPFNVLDSSLQVWHEGLVDILSRNLDEVGPLHTVPQSVSLRRWSGRADRASAAALGERTSAGLVVFGSVLRRGADSVSLRAAVLNRSRGQTEAELEVKGEVLRMGELADSLGVKILQALGQARPIGAVRRVSLGSRSLAGLKEFLKGEQFYRRGLWDSALVHYDQAITQDSNFALAFSRMAATLSWSPASAGAYRDGQEYRSRALALKHGFSLRDSLVFAADALDNQVHPAEHVADRFRAVAIVEEAARRYPQDPEIWYILGEYLYHDPPPINTGPAPALQAFDRAISLDPGFGPAYEHVVQLSMQLGQAELARRYARAYADLDSTGTNDQSLRLVGLILDAGGLNSRRIADAVKAASVQTLFRAGFEHLGPWADSAETPVALLRELATGHHPTTSADFSDDPLMWQQYVAGALLFRGHLRAAAEVDQRLLADASASPWSWFFDPFLSLSLQGVIPDSVSRRTFAGALDRGVSWSADFTPRYLRGLPWWRLRGDTVSLIRAVRRAAEVERGTRSPSTKMRAQYFGAGAMASLVLVRGDSGKALKLFQAIPDSLCMMITCFHEKFTAARLLAARGESQQAAELLDRWMWSEDGNPPEFVLAVLERARIAERLGDRKKAVECYQFVTTVWPRADPELTPYVTEAREALDRLKAR